MVKSMFIAEGNTPEIWDRVAEGYRMDMVQRPARQADFQVLLECTGNPVGRAYCEVGCGSGTTSAFLAKMGAKTTLVDRSPKALSFAEQFFQSLGLHADFFLQDALNMDLAREAFDVVWNIGVLEHFYDDDKVRLLQSMWERVRPGGTLFCSVPNRYNFPFMLVKQLRIWRGTWEYGYQDELTCGRFRKLAERASLKNIQVLAYNPVVGWCYLPYGPAIITRLGLDTVNWHLRQCCCGHMVALVARKAS